MTSSASSVKPAGARGGRDVLETVTFEDAKSLGLAKVPSKQIAIDWTDLLTAVRDLWRSSSMPAGKEHVEILWACLAVVRDGTKK